MSQLLAVQPESARRHGVGGALRALPAAIVAVIVREWRYRSDLKALQELDGRALHDLGIASGGLEHLVRHGRPFRGVRATDHGAGRAEDACPGRLMPPSWTEWR